MFEMLTDYQIWVSLLTLTALEIVLGIDNLIFLSIVSGRLPKHQQQAARRIGLALAPSDAHKGKGFVMSRASAWTKLT